MINNQLAFGAACEGLVLLENNDVLPLKPCRVALFGAGAVKTVKGGTGSGEVNNLHSVSICEGLSNYGYTICSESWINSYNEEYDRILKEHIRHFKATDIVNIMAHVFKIPVGPAVTLEDIEEAGAEACIYVISRQAGEGSDRRREDICISEQELAGLRLCAENYGKIILVLNVAGFFDLSFTDDMPQIGAIISMCGLGEEGGNALAAILCGEVNPSGRLADTWPLEYESIPEHRGEQSDYTDGIYVGYRFYDSFGVKPRFPFGYGLSYSEFSEHIAAVEASEGTINVDVAVSNMDGMTGKRAILLYAMCPQTDMPKELKRLVAFGKTGMIKRGETEIIRLSFDMDYLASYYEDEGVWKIAGGDYVLTLDRPEAVVRVPEDVIISKHISIVPKKPAFTEIKPKTIAAIDTSNFLSVKLTYKPEIADYTMPIDKAKPMNCVIGKGYLDNGAKNNIPGAAGRIEIEGQTLWMADGPAGIRVAADSVRYASGHEAMLTPHMEVFGYIPKVLRPIFFGKEKRGKIVHRNATAWPVEMAMARTFNTELVKKCATEVAAQMKEWGISYWLAPGLNIQRDFICGRNFEYFSEDPVVSGLMAAAVVKGAQSLLGTYATIKHFCCNNQEDYRNTMSANVCERALREIYLRGFQIAVRESNPKAVMTSYNKVNGTYVTESAALINTVLRNEWQFEGQVMTDWYSTSKGHANPGLAALAGTDIIMPGSGRDKRILKRTQNKYCKCHNKYPYDQQ